MPPTTQQKRHWQTAAEMVLMAAEDRGPMMQAHRRSITGSLGVGYDAEAQGSEEISDRKKPASVNRASASSRFSVLPSHCGCNWISSVTFFVIGGVKCFELLDWRFCCSPPSAQMPWRKTPTGKILALPQPPSASVATLRVEIWGSTIKEAEALAD